METVLILEIIRYYALSIYRHANTPEGVPSVLTVLNTAEAERNTEQTLPDDCESMKLQVAANKP